MFVERLNNRKNGPVESFKNDLSYKQVEIKIEKLKKRMSRISDKVNSIEEKNSNDDNKELVNSIQVDKYYRNDV